MSVVVVIVAAFVDSVAGSVRIVLPVGGTVEIRTVFGLVASIGSHHSNAFYLDMVI